MKNLRFWMLCISVVLLCGSSSLESVSSDSSRSSSRLSIWYSDGALRIVWDPYMGGGNVEYTVSISGSIQKEITTQGWSCSVPVNMEVGESITVFIYYSVYGGPDLLTSGSFTRTGGVRACNLAIGNAVTTSVKRRNTESGPFEWTFTVSHSVNTSVSHHDSFMIVLREGNASGRVLTFGFLTAGGSSTLKVTDEGLSTCRFVYAEICPVDDCLSWAREPMPTSSHYLWCMVDGSISPDKGESFSFQEVNGSEH